MLALWTVTSSELVDWIKQIPALKQVMMLDTCAAGAAAAKLMDHRDMSGDQVRAMERLKDRTGFHVLMGCAADRVSYEASQYSQGLLTYSLLLGMAGAKLREGEYVDVSGLFQYAADKVPELARGIGGVQKPLVMAPRGTSFDIGRLVEADRKALPLAQPKPLILRPLLSNAEDGDDNLKLASLVRKRLADDSFNTPRGTAVTTVYVDADETGRRGAARGHLHHRRQESQRPPGPETGRSNIEQSDGRWLDRRSARAGRQTGRGHRAGGQEAVKRRGSSGTSRPSEQHRQ